MMTCFAYPNINPVQDSAGNITGYEFIGCGRYTASENMPESFNLPYSDIIKDIKVPDAALILARDSFKTSISVYEKKR